MKLYLAGPMRGYRDFNFPTFLTIGALIEEQGHEVFNPAVADIDRFGMDAFRSERGDLADIPEEIDFDLRYSLGEDLEWICSEADAVVVLDGWEGSSGATAEVAAALALGLPVFRIVDHDTEVALYPIAPTILRVVL